MGKINLAHQHCPLQKAAFFLLQTNMFYTKNGKAIRFTPHCFTNLPRSWSLMPCDAYAYYVYNKPESFHVSNQHKC
jgi:hypothetical protein